MRRRHSPSPRQTVRTVCLFCALGILLGMGVAPASAQHKANRLQPRYLSSAPPDPARGAEVLTTFRSMGLPGDYYLEFELEVLPRRGSGRTVPGQMWGSRNAVGPIFRVGLEETPERAGERLLVQNGSTPAAWRRQAGPDARLEKLEAAALLDGVAGTGLSVFALQMPFIYWDDYVFEGVTRVRGRTVHAFLMFPPEDFVAAHPEIAGVRVHLDAQFHALMQAVVLGAEEVPLRRVTVLDLKKLNDQWIVKSIDVRDEVTRDKVRFEVTGAALDVEFSSRLFEPAELESAPRAPLGVTRFSR